MEAKALIPAVAVGLIIMAFISKIVSSRTKKQRIPIRVKKK